MSPGATGVLPAQWSVPVFGRAGSAGLYVEYQAIRTPARFALWITRAIITESIVRQIELEASVTEKRRYRYGKKEAEL